MIELSETIIDNYVEIWLSDMKSQLWVSSADAREICGLVGIPISTACQLDDLLAQQTFISFHNEKATSFPAELSSVDALLAFMARNGGMRSIAHLTPPPPFNDRPYVRPVTHLQAQKYQSHNR